MKKNLTVREHLDRIRKLGHIVQRKNGHFEKMRLARIAKREQNKALK